MSAYQIINTTPTTYSDQGKGVVNGVLVRFRMLEHNEVAELRVPEMKAETIKAAIVRYITERDALEALG